MSFVPIPKTKFAEIDPGEPCYATPLWCQMESFLGYDWEKDTLTVFLRDAENVNALGIFQNKLGALIYYSGAWKNFPLPVLITQGFLIRGQELVLDVQEVILEPSFFVNVSSINAWTYCEARVYATQYLGLVNPINDALLRGSVAHTFLAQIFSPEILLKLLQQQDWDPIFWRLLQKAIFENWITCTALCWEEEKLSAELESEFLPIQKEFMADYLKSTRNLPEIETELPVRSGLFGLNGRVDRLEIGSKSDCTLIETKTGRPTPRSVQAAENQALAYSLALRDYKHLDVSRVLVEYPWERGESRFVEKEITSEGIRRVTNIRNRVYGTLHGMKPFLFGRDSCRNCFSGEMCQFLCFLQKKSSEFFHCKDCERDCIFKNAILKRESLLGRLHLLQQYYLLFLAFILDAENTSRRQIQDLYLPLAERVSKGNCLANLFLEETEIIDDGYLLHFQVQEKGSTSGTSLRQGDFVVISNENTPAFDVGSTWGIIRMILEDQVQVLVSELPSPLPSGETGGNGYSLDPQPMEVVESREKMGLDWLVRGGFYPHLNEISALRDVILFQLVPRQRKHLPGNLQERIEHGVFDDSQKAAIRGAMQAKDIYCIQGPPGTGKTTIICEIIDLIVSEFRQQETQAGELAEHRGFMGINGHFQIQNVNLRPQFRNHRTPVLVSAFTNRAVDNIVAKLLRDYPDIKVVRLGSPESIRDQAVMSQVLENLAKSNFQFADGTSEKVDSPQIAQMILNSVDVVATTSTTAGGPLCQQMCFHAAIIDEAGQITEPSALIPATLAGKTILVGDQAQLPPVVETKNAVTLRPEDAHALKQIGLEPRGSYATSLFERLMAKWEGTEHSSLLRYQYRMNGEIAQIASELFYHGQIQTGGGPDVANQHVGQFLEQFGINPGEITDP
ncbi:MAG TPA: AAA domain-containing protein, partial [Candidatus Lokiarchaeia archaeon]|nr:AAA domain-containing protein [Candidatus Lokiarchaeia archaeon]